MASTRHTVRISRDVSRTTHEQLVRQFHASVQNSAQIRREISSIQVLASWVLRASFDGCAAVRDGKVFYTNRFFDALDRSSVIGPRWRRFAGSGERADQTTLDDEPGTTLREIALEEANLLLADPALARRRGRFARGDQVVELGVERPASSSEGGRNALVLVRDVSDSVKAETGLASMRARMLEAERASVAAELAVGVAHDLGNLVGALRARMIGLPDDPAYHLVTSAMQTILDAQAALVNRLQSVVHPRSAPPMTLDLGTDVIGPAVQMVEASLRGDGSGSRRIAIELDSSLSEEIHIVAPRDEVINMAINLFLNARDAMPHGGTIKVAARRLFGGAQVRIEDEGSGIAPENLKRIFEPLFSTKGSSGMGMGLATAAALMRRLGGDISARNRTGGGACFELTFVDPVGATPSR